MRLRVIARAGLWSALAFVLNLTWEIEQVRLYTIRAAADAKTVAWSLFHCSVGDAMIALSMFALAGFVLRRADWPLSRPWTGGAMIVIGTMAYTAWSEWHNVYQAGSWGYAPGMPLIFGIGLAPLSQWLILPPILVLACRTLEPMLLARA
jgi:amino acid transporter